MLLAKAKLIRAQRSLHSGSLKRKDMDTLKIHPANVHEKKAKEVLTRL
jgi:hypothetical protein